MSENTPKLDVEAIWARLDAATPAPWKDDGDVSGIVADSGERVTEGDNSGYGCVYISDADRALIAHAPTDLRRLLDENARLNAENERLSTLRDALAMKLGGVLTIVPQLRHIVGDGTRSEMELLDAVEVLIDKALPAAPEMPRPPAGPLKGEEIDRGFVPCAECWHPEYIGCHHCPRGVRFAVGDSEGWRLDHFAGIGCIAFCPDCRNPGTAREAAQPPASGPETPGTGSGRGTGVAETPGAVQANEWQVRITAPDGTGIVQPADDSASVHAAASKWRADLAESEVPYCVEPERRTVGPWEPTEEPSDG